MLGEEDPLWTEQENVEWDAGGKWVYERRKRKKYILLNDGTRAWRSIGLLKGNELDSKQWGNLSQMLRDSLENKERKDRRERFRIIGVMVV